MNPNTVYCSKCGASNPETFAFCGECGTTFKKSNPNIIAHLWMMAFTVPVVLLIVFFLFFQIGFEIHVQ